MLSALLFILSVVLCVWSISLLTSCAWADDITFTWLDEKAEVLYEINFVKQYNASANISKMYASWGNLYSTPAPLIVKTNVNHNQNTISNDKYGHILWWRENNLHSNNVTLIWWKSNEIYESNNNATFLWWIGNHLGDGNSITVPTVFIWWKSNTFNPLQTSWANLFIWWEGNMLEEENPYWISYLWWKSISSIQDIKNIIAWWNNILIEKNNIFAYSNSYEQFIPKTNNAFYLDVIWWVWFNRPSANEWLAVSWAVSIWEIDQNAACDDNTLWVIWSYNGCLVWCTHASRTAEYPYMGARELLDLSNECKTTCKNWKYNYSRNKCLYTWENNNSINNSSNDYTSFCLTWNSIYNFDNTVLCYDQIDYYKNVVFEATLTGTCSSNRENICEYKCKTWYDLSIESSIYKCKQGCYIKVDNEDKYIKDGERYVGDLYTVLDANSCDATCNEKKREYECKEWKLYRVWDDVETTESDFTAYCFNCCNDTPSGGTWIFYKTWSVMCNGACEWAEFQCFNWTWNSKNENIDDYPATGCSLEDQICSWYTITQDQYNKIPPKYKDYGEYTECTKYKAENNSCRDEWKMYSLKCNTWYHLNKDNRNLCESDYQTYWCDGISNIIEKPDNATWVWWSTYTAKGQNINYKSGYFVVVSKFPRFYTGYIYFESDIEEKDWDFSLAKEQCKWECKNWYEKKWVAPGVYECIQLREPTCGVCIPPETPGALRVDDFTWCLQGNSTWTLYRSIGYIEDWAVCSYICDENQEYYYFWENNTGGICDGLRGACEYENNNCYQPYILWISTGVTQTWNKRECIREKSFTWTAHVYCFDCGDDESYNVYDDSWDKIGNEGQITKTEFNSLKCLKNSCNHCAYNWFPYCFPIDFTPSCSEGLWLRWER